MLFPQTDRLAVKICGLTRAEQALAVADLGADALGINFWPKSKRYVSPAAAKEWLGDVRRRTTLVAVLVNPTPEELSAVLPLVHVLQLHGDETPEECAAVMEQGLPVIKALQVRDDHSLDAIGAYPCESLLLDAYCPGSYGGEGKTFPWWLASEAKQRFPEKKFLLAGGLTPDNVADAVRQVRPAGVDVASGVESASGVKDMDLVKRFIERARSL